MDINIVNNEKKFLAGELEGYTLKGAENKFDDKGNPLPFPGCTIICNIPLNTNLSNLISTFQKKLENFNPKKTYFYLPSSSFHMTLFDCCNLNTKNTNNWPSNIDSNMDYKDIAVELNKRIQNYIFPEKLNLKLKMFFGGYSIILEPYSEEDEIKKLLEFNKNLFQKFDKEVPKIILNKPEMSTFENMLEFKSVI